MKRIYKYGMEIEGDGIVRIVMPEKSQILSVQEQHGEIVLWALVDENPKYVVMRRFIFAVTGQAITEQDKIVSHVATLQRDNGNFVLHVFEVER